MTHYKDQILACDFFTVETLFLKTIYVLFFIESEADVFISPVVPRIRMEPGLRSRHDRLRGILMRLMHVPISDSRSRHQIYGAFDTIFRSEGMKIIRTPVQAPNANSYAERWIRSARSECLDKIIIVNQAHFRSVLTEYVDFYNTGDRIKESGSSPR